MPGNWHIWGIYVSEDLNTQTREISLVRGYSPNEGNKNRGDHGGVPRSFRGMASCLPVKGQLSGPELPGSQAARGTGGRLSWSGRPGSISGPAAGASAWRGPPAP